MGSVVLGVPDSSDKVLGERLWSEDKVLYKDI